MNKLIKSAAALLLISFAFSSCDEESDVIGLNDATKYGFIKLTLEGFRPDGEAYEVTKNFKFASSTGPYNSSSVNTYVDGDTYRDFDVARFIGPINESLDGEENSVDLNLYVNEGDSEEDEPDFVESGFGIETAVTTSDKKFFYVSEYIGIDSEDVTSYKYNPETGKLSFKFTKTLTAQENNSGFPLTVTVNVNATVFEELYNQEL
jgi:hypothetical protein